jgi:hypothetical protein
MPAGSAEISFIEDTAEEMQARTMAPVGLKATDIVRSEIFQIVTVDVESLDQHSRDIHVLKIAVEVAWMGFLTDLVDRILPR